MSLSASYDSSNTSRCPTSSESTSVHGLIVAGSYKKTSAGGSVNFCDCRSAMYAYAPAEKLVIILAVVMSMGSVDDDSVCHAAVQVCVKWCARIWMSLSMSDG